MRRVCLVVAVGMLAALPARADDQEKVAKQLSRVTAMASDPTGRRVVSMTISDMLSVKRGDLVSLRREMNLNYGWLFLAHKLMGRGITAQELSSEIKRGKSIFEVANGHSCDWREILTDAKKLNGKIERHLYEHFVDPRDDRKRDKDDNYNLMVDVAKADEDVSRDDLDSAADAYTRAKTMAMQRAGNRAEQSLDATDSLQFRRDHAREGAPKTSDVGVAIPAKH